MNSGKLLIGCVFLGAVAGVSAIVATKTGTKRGEYVEMGRAGEVATVAVNFGGVYFGQTARRTIVLHNSSSHTLLLGWRTSCGCTRLKISNSAVRPGGSSVVSLIYTELSDGTELGPATQNFLIYDRGDKAAMPEVRGTVEASCRKSIEFSNRDVNWEFVPGSGTLEPKWVTVRNVSGYPVSVHWSGDGKGVFFSISHVSAEIGSGRTAKFCLLPRGNVGFNDHPETAAIFMLARLAAPRRPIRLRYGIRVSVSPEPALEAIPGALVWSVKGASGSAESTIRLIPGPGAGRFLRMLSVATSGPELRAVRQGEAVHVSLHLPQDASFFQGDVIVEYLYRGIKSRVDVPVFATR